MAKTTRTATASTLPALDTNVLFGAAIGVMMQGGDKEAATAAASVHMQGRPLIDACRVFLTGELLELSVAAGKAAAVEHARGLLVANDVDITDKSAVRKALHPMYWTIDGQKGAPTAAAPRPAKAPADWKASEEAATEAKNTFQRSYMQADRMADRIVGKMDAEEVSIKVPKALQAEIDAMQARIVALKAEHGAAVVAEARSRSAEKAKKAKAKAAAAK